MKLMDIDRLGARETRPGILDFGILLPGISPADGYELGVKIIHERDQFLQKVQPRLYPLEHAPDPEYGDFWSTRISIESHDRQDGQSSWGSQGRYVYRYQLKNTQTKVDLDWIIDPFAREFGTGKLSAVTAGYKPYIWSEAEERWKTPSLEDLVIYEMMISEFGGSIDETIHRLAYLADLGITCIEVMPISNTGSTVDWGYMPTGYFGVDERFGKRKDFQRFIDHAHQMGIAVIVDAVYGHTDYSFPYSYVYDAFPGSMKNPFHGITTQSYVGRSTDFKRKFTQDFFFTANIFWLDRFHVDGFRYDCVAEYYDGPDKQGYANLVYSTYKAVQAALPKGGHWQRFRKGKDFNLIQCAEKPDSAGTLLRETYSTLAWQDTTLAAATDLARGDRGAITRLGRSLGLECCPAVVTCNTDTIQKTALQYIENHDHLRFLCHFGRTRDENELMQEGRRDLWYKEQPYLIGIFLAKGIPMLWQGQEFGENYYVPEPFTGRGRVHIFRPMRWDYFYTYEGRSLVRLVRDLIRIRRDNRQFRTGAHFFHDNYDRYQSQMILIFSRESHDSYSLVALNFGDSEKTVTFAFPFSGNYREELHGRETLSGVVAGNDMPITIPGNYGRIWTVRRS